MNIKIIKLAILSLVIFAVTGCTLMAQTREAQQYDDNSPTSRQCRYEAKSATANMQSALEQMFKEDELFVSCMKSKR